MIRTHAPLKRAAATLRTIAGIGETTAATLLALMPELGTLTGKQAASLAGLAPHPRQSGALDGYRRTRGGRPEVRRALFMAALSGSRYDPQLRATHERLCANAKKPLVALTAVMRKIVVIANARLKQEQNTAQIIPAN